MTSTPLTPQREIPILRSFLPIVDWLPKYKYSWLHLGVLVDFFSKPVLDGYIVGVAINKMVGEICTGLPVFGLPRL